jgi:hypothetical protein
MKKPRRSSEDTTDAVGDVLPGTTGHLQGYIRYSSALPAFRHIECRKKAARVNFG